LVVGGGFSGETDGIATARSCVRRDCFRLSGVAVLAARALEAGEAGCCDIELLGVMTRKRFFGKKRTTLQLASRLLTHG